MDSVLQTSSSGVRSLSMPAFSSAVMRTGSGALSNSARNHGQSAISTRRSFRLYGLPPTIPVRNAAARRFSSCNWAEEASRRPS